MTAPSPQQVVRDYAQGLRDRGLHPRTAMYVREAAQALEHMEDQHGVQFVGLDNGDLATLAVRVDDLRKALRGPGVFVSTDLGAATEQVLDAIVEVFPGMMPSPPPIPAGLGIDMSYEQQREPELAQPCYTCKHTDPHDGGGIGVCRHKDCGCDGPCDEPAVPAAVEMSLSSAATILAMCEAVNTILDFLSDKARKHLLLTIATEITGLTSHQDQDIYYGRIDRAIQNHVLGAMLPENTRHRMVFELLEHLKHTWSPLVDYLAATHDPLPEEPTS